MTPLTPGQRKAVEALREMYAETGEPVGCTALGKRLGVSKVTAHEVLNQLWAKDAVVQSTIGMQNYSRFRPAEHAHDTIREAAAALRDAGKSELAQRLEAVETI